MIWFGLIVVNEASKHSVNKIVWKKNYQYDHDCFLAKNPNLCSYFGVIKVILHVWLVTHHPRASQYLLFMLSQHLPSSNNLRMSIHFHFKFSSCQCIIKTSPKYCSGLIGKWQAWRFMSCKLWLPNFPFYYKSGILCLADILQIPV